MFNTYEQGMNNMHDTIKENQTLNWIQTIQRGQVDCFNQLLEVYDQDIMKRIKMLNISKEDCEDIAQIVRYKLYKQVLTYDIEQPQPFSHCVNVIIKNAKIDFIRKATSEKEQFHTKMLTIDSSNKYEVDYLIDKVVDNKHHSFEDMIVFNHFCSSFIKEIGLNAFESRIVNCTMQGKSKKEISKELNVPIKHIYNAQYRLKNRLNKQEIVSVLFDN